MPTRIEENNKTTQVIFAQAGAGDRAVKRSSARPARQRCHHLTTGGYSQDTLRAAFQPNGTGPPMKRALRSVLLGLIYISVLLALPGLVLGMACDKVVNALDHS